MSEIFDPSRNHDEASGAIHCPRPEGRPSMSLRSWLRASLPPSEYRRAARAKKAVLGWWHRNDLNRLALLFGTDKWGSHWYTQHYQRYFGPFKNKRINLLEIGVGGYENLDDGFAS